MVRVTLDLEGNIHEGFRAALEISDRGIISRRVRGSLSADASIFALYQDWRETYRLLGRRFRIEEVEAVSTVTIVELRPKTLQVHQFFNQWLTAPEFQKICAELRVQLELASQNQQEVQILLRTDNSQLRQLPWQLWELVDNYDNAEIAISSAHYQPLERSKVEGNLKILVILGNSDGIDVEADQEMFNDLPDAPVVKILKEPSRQEFSDTLWQESWDILFFAGHSRTLGETGYIDLNKEDSLPLHELRKGLKNAIRKGLQLAIFNSCDGLGLVQELETLDIPQMIVMREPVPDYVAQTFLRYFLPEFSRGKSLYASVKAARGQLEGLQDQFPGATWLPVIYQNPTAEPPTWKTFRKSVPLPCEPLIPLKLRLRSLIRSLFTVGLTSLVMTTGVTIFRDFGWLQAWELNTYDLMIRNRPSVMTPDNAIRIITIDDDQINTQNLASDAQLLPDAQLDKLLRKLEAQKPAIIAFAVDRSFPVSTKYRHLDAKIRDNENLIFSCDKNVKSPPQIQKKQLPMRVGFIDTWSDKDRVLRRQIIARSTNGSSSSCPIDYSFSTVIALQYLAATQPQFLNHFQAANGNITPALLSTEYLQEYPGLYHGPGTDVTGRQILLDYRAFNGQLKGQEVFTENKIQQILSDSYLDGFKDKIVLIGTTSQARSMMFSTPYNQDLPGVFQQAHMISQIIDVTKGQRSLLRTINRNLEILWLGSWSVIGGILALGVARSKNYLIIIITTTGMIFISCQAIINQGIVLPCVPAIITFLGSCSLVWLIFLKYSR